jgi:MFS family permease
LSPLQEAMRIALSLSDNQMAMLQGPAVGLPVVIAAVPLGFVIDRYSRVKLLSILSAVEAIGSLLTALASSFTELFVGRCLVGLAATAIVVTGFSLLADLYEPANRGRAKAVLVLGQYMGTSVAFSLGGALLSLFTSEDRWRWAMFWLTVPLQLLLIHLMLTMREPQRIGVEIKESNSRAVLIEVWRCRAIVLPLVIGITLAEVPVFAVIAWAAPSFSRTFSLPPSRVGGILGTAMMVSGIAGPVLGGTLADFCQRTGGPRRTITVLSLLALFCVPTGLFAVVPTLDLASILLGMCVMTVAATVAMGVTLFTIVIPNELRGLCLSILSAAVSLLAVSLAPVMVSLLSVGSGGRASIGKALTLVCITASVLCAATFAFARRSFAERVVS